MRHIIVLLILLALQVPYACGASSVINAFNSGELSPRMQGRTDVRKYYSGCETLENMLVLPYGGVSKRPGSYYIADAKNASVACRLISFEFSTIQAYIIEAGHEYFRFYRDVANGGVQINANYGTEDLSAFSDNIVAHWKCDDNAASSTGTSTTARLISPRIASSN